MTQDRVLCASARIRTFSMVEINLITGAFLFLMVLLSEYPFCGILSLGVFVWYAILVIKREPESVCLLLLIWFAVVANIVGCFVVEYTYVYLNELLVYSSFVGSLPLLIFSRWVFLACLYAWLTSSVCDASIRRSVASKGYVRYATVVVLLLLTVCFVQLIQNPSASSLGIDRFQYAANYEGLVFLRLANVMQYFAIIPCIAIGMGMRAIGSVTLGLYAACLYWVGTKFGSLFYTACLALIVLYSLTLIDDDRWKKRLKWLYATMIVVVVVLVLGASMISSAAFNTSQSEYLSSRLAQQGQLWWSVYSLDEATLTDEEIDDALYGAVFGESVISQNVGAKYGIYKVMYLSAPQDKIDSKLASGSRYTEGGYPAALYYGGLIGTAIFSVVMAALLAFVLRRLVGSIQRCQIIDVLIWCRFLFIALGSMSMFTFSDFFGVLSIVSYAYLIIVCLARRRGLALTRRTLCTCSSRTSASAYA